VAVEDWEESIKPHKLHFCISVSFFSPIVIFMTDGVALLIMWRYVCVLPSADVIHQISVFNFFCTFMNLLFVEEKYRSLGPTLTLLPPVSTSIAGYVFRRRGRKWWNLSFTFRLESLIITFDECRIWAFFFCIIVINVCLVCNIPLTFLRSILILHVKHISRSPLTLPSWNPWHHGCLRTYSGGEYPNSDNPLHGTLFFFLF
jgi:hypothetical protein